MTDTKIILHEALDEEQMNYPGDNANIFETSDGDDGNGAEFWIGHCARASFSPIEYNPRHYLKRGE